MEWLILLLTFGIIFLGELGDKTQLIVFNLSLEHNKAYKIGIGATLGFAIIVTIGVFLGILITEFIPLFIIALISGFIFILIGILDVRHLKKLYHERQGLKEKDKETIVVNNNKEKKKDNNNSIILSKLYKLKKNPYVAGFGFIFLMELGDKTQLLTITLASMYEYPIEVWLGAFLALTFLAWIGVFFGDFVARKVPKFQLKLLSFIIFIFVGILIIVTSF